MRLYLDTSVFSAYYDERAPERLALTRSFWGILQSHERFCSDLTIEELKTIQVPKLRDQLLDLTQGFSILWSNVPRDIL